MANWSGLWDRQYGTPYAMIGGNTPEYNNTLKQEVANLSRGRGGRVLTAIIAALTGAAAGQTAASTYKQVDPDPALGQSYSGGGKRTVSTKTDINRATTAADLTLVDNLLGQINGTLLTSTDKSGNGGGGKVGSF